MESFQAILKLLTCLMLILMMLSGCTDKDNLTGNNFSGISALTVDDETGIIMGFSFPAAEEISISGSETKLLAGNYNAASALSFFRFTGLPTNIESTEIDSCFLSLNIAGCYELRNSLTLKLYKLNKVWTDSLDLANITESDLSTDPIATYLIANTSEITGEEITFPLLEADITNWQNPDSTGWNLALKVENEGWVEISSRENSYSPKLQIKYKTETEGEWITYNQPPTKDTYTLKTPVTNPSDQWKISNLTSTCLYVKYEPTSTIFVDNEGNQLTDEQRKRMTINKASLVLYIKNDDYYHSTNSYSLRPFNVVKDSITDPVQLLKSDYEKLVYTYKSEGYITGDSLTVNITPIIQAYTSGDKIPKGIMIQSTQERQNFGTLEFWDCNDSTPIEKKPYVKITYTPPYL